MSKKINREVKITRNILMLGYPYNIFYLIGIGNPNDDQIRGLEEEISKLDSTNKEILAYRFKYIATSSAIADLYGMSKQGICDRINKFLDHLFESEYVQQGYSKVKERSLILNEKGRNHYLSNGKYSKNTKIDKQLYLIDLIKLKLSTDCYCSIAKSGKRSVGELIEFIFKNPEHWNNYISGISDRDAFEVISKLFDSDYIDKNMFAYLISKNVNIINYLSDFDKR